jgi:hypothetical protein
MTFPTPHIGHSRHGLFFTRLNCKSNAKPSEKDHDLPGTFEVAVSTQPLHYLGRQDVKFAKFVLIETPSYVLQTWVKIPNHFMLQ